jgi:hypothetical protein
MKLARTFASCLAAAFAVAPLAGGAAQQRLPRDFTIPASRAVASAVHGAMHTAEASKGDIGSSNTVTADAPVSRPNESPCVDKLFVNATFAQYAGVPFSYAPPRGCPGPFAKIVFNGDFSVSAGVQFDRTASIQLGDVPIYFGTTAEPGGTLSPSWHVERDVTEDAALFAAPQVGEADIFNIVNSTYTGVISGTAYLQFYPARGAFKAADTPQVVLPFPGVAGGPQHLNTGTSVLSATYALPANVDGAYFEVYAQSQQTDEQYFLCAPNDVAADLFTCGNTAFRETEVSIDGTPAGVAPIYPWIYTGGLDPYLWFPIPGLQTLEFKPYHVDLTPFAALLSNGKPHTVAISVDNADNYFQAIATFYAFQDPGSKHVTGALTRDTLSATPNVSVKEKFTGQPPALDGTALVTNTRPYEIDGYVNTSKGKVSTAVSSTVYFGNRQVYSNESDTTGKTVVSQSTYATTQVITQGRGVDELERSVIAFPISLSLDIELDNTGTGTQVTSIDQQFVALHTMVGTKGNSMSYESNDVSPTDTLDILDDEYITGNANMSSTQTYQAFDSTGLCYAQTIRATSNVLTSVANAPCNRTAVSKALLPLLAR